MSTRKITLQNVETGEAREVIDVGIPADQPLYFSDPVEVVGLNVTTPTPPLTVGDLYRAMDAIAAAGRGLDTVPRSLVVSAEAIAEMQRGQWILALHFEAAVDRDPRGANFLAAVVVEQNAPPHLRDRARAITDRLAAAYEKILAKEGRLRRPVDHMREFARRAIGTLDGVPVVVSDHGEGHDPQDGDDHGGHGGDR